MSKYGNIRKQCFSQHLHASKLEANYCNRLLAMRQKGEIGAFDIQVSFDLYGPNRELICTHVVDFVVWINGRREVHETKGHATDVWRIKKKLFEANYPDIKYLVVRRGS